MTYTDVFGSATLPPSEYGYASFTLTTNATFVWPYNTNGSPYPVAKVMDIACDAGNEVTLPDCTEVSTGEDFLIRNVGANVLIVKDAAGVQVASVAVGAASYFYLTDNTTAAGVFGVIGFGVGTSTADASSLVGYGIKAVGASLNQAHPVQPTNTGITLSADHRAKLVVFTGGVATFALDSAATLGDDYFTMFRNDGTGTATIDPAASELIDGMASMQVQPGESLMLICTGTKWYSVGYGRSTLYQFTQLTKDVSAGGTITLSATEAANKLITFIGNPSAAVNVVVPAVVAVYYTQSAISTAQTITLKTSAGSGVGINQGARVIALCDGTNVVSAQSAVANTSVSLTDGSALIPSLFFATQTNTGLFKSGTQDVGVTVGGSAIAVFGSTGLQTTTIGPNLTQRHTLPAIPSDTVTLNTATQTLTDKTISVDNNTISGIAASSFVLSNASGNIDGSAAQKVIPTGVVVGTTDTQTLTNKTLTAPVINSPTGITKGDVGLGNVDNTSDATKNAAVATLTNKTLTAPVINSPTGITKGDVGLGSVDNTSDANKPVSTAQQAALDLKANAASPATTGTFTHSGDIVLSGSGKRITGDFSNATIANRVMFQTSTAASPTVIGAIPSSGGAASQVALFDSTDTANSHVAQLTALSTEARIASGAFGTATGTYLPMTFYTGGSERMRIDTSGNVQIGTTLNNVYDGTAATRPLVVSKSDSSTALNTSASAIVVVNPDQTSGNSSQINFATLNSSSSTIQHTAATISTIFADRSGSGTNQYPSGQLVFSTNPGYLVVNGGPLERMRIDSSGNVGIGTSSPYGKFDVYSGTNRHLGIAAANTLTSGSKIESLNDAGTANVGMEFRASDWAWISTGTERARIDSSGNLLIGTTSALGKIASVCTTSSLAAARIYQAVSGNTSTPAAYIDKYDNNSTTSQVFLQFTINQTATGCGQINGNGASQVAFGSFSDSRLKENIFDLPAQLKNICSLRPVEFDYIESEGGGHQIGFIAQEMQEVYPDAVGERQPDGMLTVTGWSKTEARLVKAIQELKAELDAANARIEQLEAK